MPVRKVELTWKRSRELREGKGKQWSSSPLSPRKLRIALQFTCVTRTETHVRAGTDPQELSAMGSQEGKGRELCWLELTLSW